jgi:two-component system cell cycle sensor histidine kinase/response regulator CckA
MDGLTRLGWMEGLAQDLGGAFWKTDAAFERFVYLGPGIETILGIPREDLYRDASPLFRRLVPVDHLLPHDEPRPFAGEILGPWAHEFRIDRPDGGLRWVRNHGRPLYDGDGQLTGYAGIALDVTDQRAAAEAHRRSEAELAAVFRALPDLVLVLDRDGRYLRVASGDRRQLYRPESELVGRTLHDVLPERIANRFLSRIEQALKEWEVVDFRYPLEIEGKTEWFDALVAPMTDEQVLWVARTITDRMELERQLAHASKLDALGQLAGGIAHDFNNVITVIRGTTTLLAESIADPAALADLDDIRGAAARASTLTRQLLAFSRQQVLRPERLCVAEVIGRMGRMLSRIIGEHIELVIRTGDEDGAVLMDPGQLEHIVANLVVNARHAIDESGRIRIEVESQEIREDHELVASGVLRPGGHVCLSVIDDGSGMEQEILDRAFEPFFTTKPAGEGTGLGLSMVYGTVRQSGGHVEIDSEPGLGTTVRILLPGAEAAEPVEDMDGDRLGAIPPATVLVVEDEAPVRRLIRRFLEGAGLRVVEAADGETALARIRTNLEVDIVLTDVVMPRMGGAELMRRLQKRRPEVPVVLMSGYTGSELEGGGPLQGAAAFLAKPFERADLLRLMKAVLADGTRA